ncbi:TPA: hypothetical protein ACY4RW_001282 [Clostridium perfringens]
MDMVNNVYGLNFDLREIKEDMTVSTYIDSIEKYTKSIDDKQKGFAEVVARNLFTKANKINVYSARCGMGKSVIIRAFLKNLIKTCNCWGEFKYSNLDLDGLGAILVTDTIERLEEVENDNDLKKYCYLMKWDKKDIATEERVEFDKQIKEQSKYPILLMTTQKYFRMTDAERKAIYKWNYKGNQAKRQIVIFDERPILTSTTIVNEEYLSKISIALDYVEECEEKEYLIEKFNSIRDELSKLRSDYTENSVTWIKKSRQYLLNEKADKKFFNILEKYVSIEVLEKCKKLKEIYTDGALWVNKKDKNSENTRNIILLKDNLDKFDKEISYHIFDATAKFDMDYIIDKDRFNFVSIDDKKEKKDINIVHIPLSTSQNSLKSAHPENIECINTWINKTFKDNEAFVATYSPKSGIYNKFAKNIKQDLGYFGNIKGSNKFKDKSKMIHIGLNRCSDVVYLYTYILIKNRQENLIDKWNDKDICSEDIKNEIENLLKMEKGYFIDEYMYYIMRSKLLVDLEQNIFRIKCRNFNNTEECKIYMICSKNDFNVGMLKRLADKVGASLKEETPIIFKDAGSINRANKVKGLDNFIKWFDNWDGDLIKASELKKICGVNNEQFKTLKKNESVKSRMAKINTPMRGYYQKIS